MKKNTVAFTLASLRSLGLAGLLLAGGSVHGQAPIFTTLVQFTGTSGAAVGERPYAELLQASDGDFYGTTARGGAANFGTIYKITAGGTFTPLRSFTGAANPTGGLYPIAGLAEHSDGVLYGASGGDFNPGNGTGTHGIAYRVTASGTTFTNYLFFSNQIAPKGSAPLGSMTKASDGFFYGTTQYGGTGASSFGTIYKINPTTGALTTVIEFSNNGTNNKGSSPNAKLVDGGDGYLYGSSYSGGSGDFGTIFRLRVSNGSLTTLGTFTNAASPLPGKNPIAAMVLANDGFLYGTTANGGTANAGVIYRVNPAAGTVATIAEFTNATGNFQGAHPVGAMAQGTDGHFYGTTANGGTGDHGTIFRLTTGGVLTAKLIEFTGTTGAAKGEGPYAGLTRAADGRLYGTTLYGGAGNKGTVYRLELPPAPLVVTGSATGITGTTATLNGTVNSRSAATTWQFEYGTTTSYGSVIPATPGNTSGGNTAEAVSTALTGLPAGSTWHYRLTATNAGGTTLGNNATFTTSGGNMAPVVVTGAAGSVTGSSATLNGTVNPQGNAASWQFEYGLTTSYGSVIPLSAGATGSGSAPEAVSTVLSGLPPGSTWHYRLKATSTGGTVTGADATFTTTGTPLPAVVVTGTATDVGGTSAVLNGTVNPRGHAATWQFEYGADESYGSVIPLTPGDTTTGNSAEPVSITLTGLTPDTTVYFRLTATNTVGTVPGSGRSFTTAKPPLAVTQAAIGITTTNATLKGSVNPNGAETLWQFEYGPDSSYGSVAPLLSGTTGAGTSPESVTANLTGLAPGSTWHYRLKAVNSAGTAYGDNFTFTTRQAPAVATTGVTAVTATGGTLNGTVNPWGSATTWQFEYGTTTAYGQTLPAVAGDAGNGSAPQNVSVTLTGLLPNTLYYYRLNATSTYGTGTTTGSSFTTANNIAGWRQLHFGTMTDSGNAANSADPDGDGVVNLLEYGFGMNPKVRDGHLRPSPGYNGSNLIASFSRPAGVDDVTYSADVSTNLVNWTIIANGGSGSAQTFSAPVSPAGRNWMRLKVTLIP